MRRLAPILAAAALVACSSFDSEDVASDAGVGAADGQAPSGQDAGGGGDASTADAGADAGADAWDQPCNVQATDARWQCVRQCIGQYPSAYVAGKACLCGTCPTNCNAWCVGDVSGQQCCDLCASDAFLQQRCTTTANDADALRTCLTACGS